MRIIPLTIFLLLLCICPQSVHAHEGHWDQLGLDEAIEVGKTEIKRLANEHQISGSWIESAEFNYDKTDMQTVDGKQSWVIAFDNASEGDPAKKTIQIIMTHLGKFVAFEFIKN